MRLGFRRAGNLLVIAIMVLSIVATMAPAGASSADGSASVMGLVRRNAGTCSESGEASQSLTRGDTWSFTTVDDRGQVYGPQSAGDLGNFETGLQMCGTVQDFGLSDPLANCAGFAGTGGRGMLDYPGSANDYALHDIEVTADDMLHGALVARGRYTGASESGTFVFTLWTQNDWICWYSNAIGTGAIVLTPTP